MVLVGHSMGGLICELQTLDSGNDIWNTISDQPFQLVKAPTATRQDLADTFFFQPSPSVRRVITIGTPFRGSEFANSTTRWIGSKLIKLPKMLVDDRQQLHKENPQLFRKANLIDVDTSIDSLAPDSPILPVMLNARRPPWVKYHNIVGLIPDKGFLGYVAAKDSDGVVKFTSAHMENVTSEIVVNADHTAVNRHPLSVLEVHRILLEHLRDMQEMNVRPPSRLERLPMTASTTNVPWGPRRNSVVGNGASASDIGVNQGVDTGAPLWPNGAPAQSMPPGASPFPSTLAPPGPPLP